MPFLDDEDEFPEEPEPERPRRPERPEREISTPQRRRQQFLVRRLLGVGIGLGFVILFVVGFRGCLEARSDRGLRDYTQDISGIMQESQVSGEEFFEALEGGSLTEQQLEEQISAIRSAASGQLDRAENLGVPDQMRDAQGATTQALRLRRDGLDSVTNSIGAATGDTETADSIDAVTQAMGSFYASDILWSQLATPEIQQVLQDDDVESADLPTGNFMPESDPTRFLDEQEVVEIITGISGEDPSAGGVRGLELVQVNVGDTTLDPETTTTVADDAREVIVQVLNGGEETERAVEVVVNFGDEEISEPIPQLEPGATEQAAIPLDTIPQPGTEIQIDVLVTPVPGELDSSNNEASYSVLFGSG